MNKIREYYDTDPITQLEARAIQVAYGGFGGNKILDCRGFDRFTYSIVADSRLRFNVDGMLEPSAAAVDEILNLVLLSGVVSTPYNGVLPQGNNGYVIINAPFMRFALTELDNSNTTYSRIYIKLWS